MKKKVSLIDINRKLDTVIKNQRELLKQEASELEIEHKIEQKESKELSELERLERIEKEIEKVVVPHPLTKITYHDIARGILGSFVGVLAHYTFIYGIKVAEEISLLRAYLLFPVAFIVGGIFMYCTGFRKVRDPKILWFLPVRLLVLYTISLVMTFSVLLFFSPDFGQVWDTSVKQLATVTLLGVIGAITADLIGKE
jgi:uncharacterized membrane protein